MEWLAGTDVAPAPLIATSMWRTSVFESLKSVSLHGSIDVVRVVDGVTVKDVVMVREDVGVRVPAVREGDDVAVAVGTTDDDNDHV